ncbi:MAG: hypothetical protein QOJ49_1332 [Actinomycetota bacterium]|nr:hypothetical protein [Actinomycetota bacterium]
MLIRWFWRFVAVFLGRKAWEAYQRRQQRRQYPGTPPR